MYVHKYHCIDNKLTDLTACNNDPGIYDCAFWYPNPEVYSTLVPPFLIHPPAWYALCAELWMYTYICVYASYVNSLISYGYFFMCKILEVHTESREVQ